MCLMDQLPSELVLTPAISCTKFKIHSAHADSLMAKHFFLIFLLGRASLCVTDQVLDGPTPFWVGTYTSYLLHKVQGLFSPYRQFQGQNIFFHFFQVGPGFESQTRKPRKRMCLVHQLLYGSILTPAISLTKFKIHSAHTDSLMTKTFFFSFIFLRRTSSSKIKKLRTRMCLVHQLPCG